MVDGVVGGLEGGGHIRYCQLPEPRPLLMPAWRTDDAVVDGGALDVAAALWPA